MSRPKTAREQLVERLAKRWHETHHAGKKEITVGALHELWEVLRDAYDTGWEAGHERACVERSRR